MRSFTAALLVTAAALAPAAAQAQSAIDSRVDRLEHEMHAVQRKVFPNGPERLIEPEVTPARPSGTAPGVPASNPLSDLSARVAALETQLRSLTGQEEVTSHRLQQLEDAFAAYKHSTDARLQALEAGASAVAPRPDAVSDGPAPTSAPARPGRATAPPPSPRAAAAQDGERAARIAAIERPKTGDPAEDGYLYGYRLWEAKLYPEAEAALDEVATKYPKHRRASYAANLLGRAFLEDGKPARASRALLESYQKWPDGDRAPESLYYLGQALMTVKPPRPVDACRVYVELDKAYGAKLTPELAARVARARRDAKCAPPADARP